MKKNINIVLFILICMPQISNAKILYTKNNNQPIFKDQGKTQIAVVNASTPLKVLDETDKYYKISIDAWIPKSKISMTKQPDKIGVVQVVNFTKENRQTGNSYDVAVGKYFRMIVFKVNFTNNGDKEIYSWEGDLIVKNKNGAEILVMKLQSQEAELKPGMNQVLPTILEEKDFKVSKDFEYIYSLKRKDLVLELTNVFIELKP